MDKKLKEELVDICTKISEDVESDAAEFDGKPFTGYTIGTYFGNHGAAIQGLANILKEVISCIPEKTNNHYVEENI